MASNAPRGGPVWGVLLLCACKAGTVLPGQDSAPASDDSAVDSWPGWPEDSGAPGDTDSERAAPEDADGDGATTETDCDDNNAQVHPSADEVFNGADDDCDGQVDAVGVWTGTVSVSARATYEGKAYSFSLSCPASLERELVDADFEVVCTTDAEDEWAQLLLGATLSFTPDDSYLWDLALWEGVVVVRSSNGWDSRGEGEVRWSSVEQARLKLTLSATWLTVSGSGELRP